jgi:hypothetical protein
MYNTFETIYSTGLLHTAQSCLFISVNPIKDKEHV